LSASQGSKMAYFHAKNLIPLCIFWSLEMKNVGIFYDNLVSFWPFGYILC
jgi:hypothetical protein